MIQLNIIVLASVFGALFCFAAADFDGKKDIGFYIYTRKGPKEGVKVEIDDSQGVNNSGYDPRFPTKFVTHGFTASYDTAQVQLIKDAYLQVGEYNIIGVDWANLAFDWDVAIVNNHNIGQYIAQFIIFLTEKHGTKLSDVHVIGHSLGGQLVGFVGDIIKDPKVGRITGLDPAGADPYANATKDERLDKEDAVVVDVFHTSTIGLEKEIGHVDYFPNGGKNQTGCGSNENIDDGCDHATSWQYFADSILHPENYLAVRCVDLQDALSGTCSGDMIRMGEYMLPATSGIFYQKITKSG